METGTWWRTGSFSAGDVFSDPLDGCSSSSTPPTQTAFEDYSEYDDSYRLEIQGPQDERDLRECLGTTMCPFSPSTNMKELNLTHEILYESYSPTSYDGMTIQTCVPVTPETEKVWGRRRPMLSAVPPEKEETPATTAFHGTRGGKEEQDEEIEEERREGGGSTRLLPCHRRRRPAPAATRREDGECASSLVDVLDHIPKSGSGVRGPRKRGTWKRGTWLSNHFLNAPCLRDLCSASKGEKKGRRKNNKHWTPKEVKLLVDGISVVGASHWTELKHRWFSDTSDKDPVRTAVNLKDKWRNLVQTYLVKPTSKKKGNAPLGKEVINKIKMLAVHHPYPKRSCSNE